MLSLDELVDIHAHDFAGKDVFTTFTAVVPVYRLRVSLLVAESIEADPIDLFLLEGVGIGLDTPQKLAAFFGLEDDVVVTSLGGMLHNSWISMSNQPGTKQQLTLLPRGSDAVSSQRANLESTHESEVRVDGFLGSAELSTPSMKLMRPSDAKKARVVRWAAVVPQPRKSSDLDFAQLEKSVAQLGSQLWPGVQHATLLDILGQSPKGVSYRTVEVIVFQGSDPSAIEFEVFEHGVRQEAYEIILRRQERQGDQRLVPTQIPPSASELDAFREEAERITQLAATQSQAVLSEPEGQSPEVLSETGPVAVSAEPRREDTRDRLRAENAELVASNERQRQIIEGQGVLRNHENRLAWKRILTTDARRYVVAEFPWINAEAVNDEIIDAITQALRRGVRVWIAWGLNEKGTAGKPPADPAVLARIEGLRKQYGDDRLVTKYRGNTHRKVLVWDDIGAIIGSFNFGSFRGDPKRSVRHEVSALMRSPREIANLVTEYRDVFGVPTLTNYVPDEDGMPPGSEIAPVEVGAIVNGIVTRIADSGVYVRIGSQEAFVPFAELFGSDKNPNGWARLLKRLVGHPLSIKVLSRVDGGEIVCSERAAIADRQLQP